MYHHLAWVCLMECGITSIHVPSQWSSSLVFLSLSENELSSLEFASSLLQLKYLDISHNEIQSITPLSKCTRLETLILSFNYISHLQPLKELTRLVMLHLDHNCISNPREIFHLRHLENIRALNVQSNVFCRMRDAIPFVLHYLKGRLRFINNTNVSQGMLDESRRVYEGVLTVDVIAQEVGEAGFSAEMLSFPSMMLREVRLSDEVMFKYLHTLILEKNNISQLQPLASLPFLRVLNLNKNKIRRFSGSRVQSASSHGRVTRRHLSRPSSKRSGRSTTLRSSSPMHRSQQQPPRPHSLSQSQRSSSAKRANGTQNQQPQQRGLSPSLSRKAYANVKSRYESTNSKASKMKQTSPGTTNNNNNNAKGAKVWEWHRSLSGRADRNHKIQTSSLPPPTNDGTGSSLNLEVAKNDSRRKSSQQHNHHGHQRSNVGESRSSSARTISSSTATAHFPSLEVLHLEENGIHDLTPLLLHTFPSLKVLNLQRNDIASTQGLYDIPTLQLLNLGYNRIKDIEEDTLSCLHGLEELHLEYNRLHCIDNVGPLQNLQCLLLNHNKINTIDDIAIASQMRTLRELSVLENPLVGRRYSRFEMISEIPQLHYLCNVAISDMERMQAEVLFSPTNNEEDDDRPQNDREAAVQRRGSWLPDLVPNVALTSVSTRSLQFRNDSARAVKSTVSKTSINAAPFSATVATLNSEASTSFQQYQQQRTKPRQKASHHSASLSMVGVSSVSSGRRKHHRSRHRRGNK
eukprot:m.207226 g.207226  ORF g.207226 m.207226 type:complete len:747 (-) comp13761_c1_seq2:946-3186(-)